MVFEGKHQLSGKKKQTRKGRLGSGESSEGDGDATGGGKGKTAGLGKEKNLTPGQVGMGRKG